MTLYINYIDYAKNIKSWIYTFSCENLNNILQVFAAKHDWIIQMSVFLLDGTWILLLSILKKQMDLWCFYTWLKKPTYLQDKEKKTSDSLVEIQKRASGSNAIKEKKKK